MSYINPVPGVSPGRTDQGVDFAAPPGTPILAITREKLAGIIQNWYQGQPYYWFQQLDAKGKATGVYNYVAEQFSSNLKVGQTVEQGQQIGVTAQSGSGLELGFATSSGQTLAHVTSGYTEGVGTPAGDSYRQQVVSQGRKSAVPSYVPTKYKSWVATASQNTGLPPSIVAAQINDESGFNPNAQSGAGAEGIAQFEPGTWKSLKMKGSPFDPNASLQAYSTYMSQLLNQYNGNVRDALAAYNAGPKNIQAGYGYADTILSAAGANRSYVVTPNAPITRPGGTPSTDTGSGVDSLLQNYTDLRDTSRTPPPGTKNPFQWWLASFSGNWDKVNGA